MAKTSTKTPSKKKTQPRRTLQSKVKSQGRAPANGKSATPKASSAGSLPPRGKVKLQDTWDLDSLFKSDAEWESAFADWSAKIPGFAKFKGRLADSAQILADALKFDADIDRQGERLGVYAFLKTAEDQGNSDYQRMKGRYQHAATQAGEAASFIRPEIMSIPPETVDRYLESAELAEWKLALERPLRYRPHTLS